MKNILVIILAVSFCAMALLIYENALQSIVTTLFGVTLVGVAYFATRNEKSKKKFSEKGLLKNRSYRTVYASAVITIIISLLTVVAYYLIYDPTWSKEFNLTISWILYFGFIAICSFGFTATKMK